MLHLLSIAPYYYTRLTTVTLVTALRPRVLSLLVLDSSCTWYWVLEVRPDGPSQPRVTSDQSLGKRNVEPTVEQRPSEVSNTL